MSVVLLYGSLYVLTGSVLTGTFVLWAKRFADATDGDIVGFYFLGPLLWPISLLAIPALLVYGTYKAFDWLLFSKKDKVAKVKQRLTGT